MFWDFVLAGIAWNDWCFDSVSERPCAGLYSHRSAVSLGCDPLMMYVYMLADVLSSRMKMTVSHGKEHRLEFERPDRQVHIPVLSVV